MNAIRTPRVAAVVAVATSLVIGLNARGHFPPLWPPDLHFGEVRVGAVVEGTVGAHLGEFDRDGAPIEVIPPKGLFIDGVESIASKLYTNMVESPDTKLRVQFTVDTRVAGQRSGTLTMRLGAESREIPFSVTVVEPSESALRLLVVDPPVSDGSHSSENYGRWTSLMAAGDFDPTYLDVRPPRGWLIDREFDDYYVVALSLKSIITASDADWEKLSRWTERGGRLILFAQGEFKRAEERLRPLLKEAGLALESVKRVGDRFPFKIEQSHILMNAFTEGVIATGWSMPSTIDLVDAEKGRLLVIDPKENGERGFVGMGPVGSGDVILVSDGNPWSWIARDGFSDTPLDNPKLMRNFLTVGLPRELAPVADEEKAGE